MMRKKIMISVFLVTMLLSSCLYSERVRGSGRSVTFNENFSDFSELDFSNAIDAVIEYGNEYEIVVSIDDNLKDYVEIEKRGDKLYLGLQDHVSYSRVDYKVHITMPFLASIDASGASEIKISGFKTDEDFRIDVSGATELEGFINVGDLYLDVSGASEIELIGSGKKLTIDGSGASEMNFGDFKVASANIELSGASEVVVNVQEELNVDCSGASEVKYYGNPRLKNISTSGASEIKSLE
ncbi:MAG: DUF2807 domain-containing protein [Candidatus Marinimicrobia bacterium]|nr:DUF2807 domain-containing protein [Candidatus Neomarinimicrobiota bacterium]